MTATTSSTPRPRRGFTLVEVLVAMALILFIMVILTEAFTAGTEVFRTLKSQGDMQERLRGASSMLRNDLRQIPGQQVHFGGTDPILSALAAPPTNGYLFIQQPLILQQTTPPVLLGTLTEGIDGWGTPSVRMNTPLAATTAQLPALCFTLQRFPSSIQPQDYFSARIPGSADYPTLPNFTQTEQQFFTIPPIDYQQPLVRANPNTSGLLLSRWAEVGYFLVPTGNFAGTNNSMPLFTLRRRVRVVLTDPGTTLLVNTPSALPPAANPRIPSALLTTRYAEASCLPDPVSNNYLHFNTPVDLANPLNQMMPQSLVPLGTLNTNGQGPINNQGLAAWNGDDLVLSDVISFNVRVIATGGADFVDLSQLPLPQPGVYNSATFPYNLGLQIYALEITIRVWDVKTSLARQVTIVQDM